MTYVVNTETLIILFKVQSLVNAYEEALFERGQILNKSLLS